MRLSRSWQWWIQQLTKTHQSLVPEPLLTFRDQLPLVVRNLDPLESEQAVEALRHFAETRRFPPAMASTDVLDLRLRYAIFQCYVWKDAKRPVEQATFSEVFRWLTIDCFDGMKELWADTVAKAGRGL